MTDKKPKVVNLASHRGTVSQQVLVRVFEEHGRALRTFIRRRIGPQEEPEDVIQEVFARIAKLDDLEARMSNTQGSVRSYLFTTANNLMVDMERHKEHERRYSAEQFPYEKEKVVEVTPESILESEQELEYLKSVIAEMRPHWRKVFLLHRFKNMSYRQIADAMNINVKQVENYMAQAMSRIREAGRKLREGEVQ